MACSRMPKVPMLDRPKRLRHHAVPSRAPSHGSSSCWPSRPANRVCRGPAWPILRDVLLGNALRLRARVGGRDELLRAGLLHRFTIHGNQALAVGAPLAYGEDRVELSSMKKEQLDPENRTVWIPDSKTPNGVAEVPLTEIAVEASRSQLALLGSRRVSVRKR